jgi:signal transduction histidine kinase
VQTAPLRIRREETRMLQFILDHRLDSVAFALATLAVAVVAHWRIKRGHGASIGKPTWALLIVVIALGVGAAELAGNHERNRLRDMLQGIAPTYAQELQRMGHWKITLDTKPDDPLYLSMIQAEIRWLKVNPGINDVYTFRKYPDGKVRLIVDSETDYNRNGAYDEEREQRTAIGEEYDADENLLKALDGQALFDGKPYTDRWGTWVSAYAPMFDDKGNVDGVAGVDYDAKSWITSTLWNRVATLGFASIVAVILLASSITVAITHVELKRRIAAEAEREQLQKELISASRQAGMAEIATGVLHNVGNVLNSVNVAACIVGEKIRQSKVPALGKAVAMIQEHQQDLPEFLTRDDKGKQLPGFLGKLADFLAEEQNILLGEVDQLHRSLDHIKQIVSAQQQFARCGEQKETFSLPEVIEDAINMNILALGRHGVTIEKQYGDCPAVFSDKHKVLQILVNLISNAKKAVKDVNVAEKKVTLSLDTIERDGKTIARLRVIDNGVGIPAENLQKIFQHGFTTRSDGHGFGLHSSAIAARNMGGALAVSSDGAGKGATFTLELPAATTEAVVREVANA